MNVLKEMYNILYPEEIKRMQEALNEMLEETKNKIKEFEKNAKKVTKPIIVIGIAATTIGSISYLISKLNNRR